MTRLISKKKVEVKEYLVRHITTGRYVQKKTSVLAQIKCYNTNAKDYEFLGYINFYHNDLVPASAGPPMNPNKTSATEHFHINFPISRIGEILDTLRQEKPVYIAFSTYAEPEDVIGEVMTGSSEPVGEEEGV